MNVLFVCSLNKIRSLTAERIFEKYPGMHVRSAGTQSNARVVLGEKLLQLADIIFVMEPEHEAHLRKEFPKMAQAKRIVVLGIENGYEYMDPELIEILEREVGSQLSILSV